MTEEEAFDRISQLIKAGITNRQLARMVGVPVEVVLAYKRKRGSHKSATQVALIQRKTKKSWESASKEIIGIPDPRERREAMYGQALMAFELKQAAEGRRDKLPCHAPSPEALARCRRRDVKSYKPLEIAGITFASRTCAAEALGVSRGEFSAMISDKATPFRRQKLARMLGEYKRKVAAGSAA